MRQSERTSERLIDRQTSTNACMHVPQTMLLSIANRKLRKKEKAESIPLTHLLLGFRAIQRRPRRHQSQHEHTEGSHYRCL
jgi:hypothetical protein